MIAAIRNMVQANAETALWASAFVLVAGALSALVASALLGGVLRRLIQAQAFRAYASGGSHPSKWWSSDLEEEFNRLKRRKWQQDDDLPTTIARGEDVLRWIFGDRWKVLFGLQYQQLAAQLFATINTEAVRYREAADYTPLTNFLVIAATRQGASTYSPEGPDNVFVHAGQQEKRQVRENLARLHLDIATREIDILQALLSARVERRSWIAMFCAWTVVHVVVIYLAPEFTEIRSFEALLWPFGLGVLLSLAIATVGIVLFSWLDRWIATR